MLLKPGLRNRLHETRSVRNRYEIGMPKSWIYTGPDRSTLDRFSYPVPNGFTCRSDPVWNYTLHEIALVLSLLIL